MTQDKEIGSWEDDFIKKFSLPHWEETGYNLKYVQDYIRQNFLSKEEVKRVIEGGRLNSTMPDLSVNRIEYEDGYNAALSDLLAKLGL